MMRFLLLLLGSALLTACQGCGQGLELATVQGVVQYNGTPLTGGNVIFSPVDHHSKADGQIKSDGTYALKTIKRAGSAPGSYRVTIVTDLEIRGKEVRIICQSPKKYLLKVEAEKENQFVINISQTEGWKQSIDD
ncbi:MAG: hypothetical protein ABGX16_17950 [Pirellulales bacterium]